MESQVLAIVALLILAFGLVSGAFAEAEGQWAL